MALEAYAALFGRAERSLFAALQAAGDRDANALKRDFQREFGLTARQYNAIRVGLEGRIASIKERRPELLAEGGQRIARAKKVIARIKADLRDPAAALKAGRRVTPLSPVDRQEVIAKAESKLHQKKRRLAILEARHGRLALDHQHGIIRLCFGSKRLFRAQFALQANGYADHGEWLAAWRAARSAQLLVLGSKDETGGCQGCVAGVAQDDSLTLRLRLPDALIQLHGKYIVIPDVRFAYGQERILAALQSQRMLSATKSGRIAAKRVGSPISYRFLRDEKGWRLFASVEAKAPERVSSTLAGAIGIDINADHLAVTRVDRFGNWADSLRFETPSHGKSEKQVEALLGEAAKEIAGLAATFG
ncbi:MAG: IS200/IS605 family accessory protein TnpB-related protein, partial [Pseudomonadota bacterium]